MDQNNRVLTILTYSIGLEKMKIVLTCVTNEFSHSINRATKIRVSQDYELTIVELKVLPREWVSQNRISSCNSGFLS